MKKLLAFGLATAMITSVLTGCGGSADNGSTTGTSTEGNEVTTEGNQSGMNETFVIGALGPLTGGAASYGISVKQGAEVAIKEINAAGGVTVGDVTYELALNFLDDEAKEDTAITAYNSLMDQGINALMGTVTSGACLAITDLTYADGILQLTPSGSAILCTEYPNAFRLCFTDPLQGETLADYVAEEMELTKVAIIFDNSEEYSTGIKDAFVEKAAENGLEIVAAEAFSGGDVDFATQLTKIKGTDAEVIVAPIYYSEAAHILRQSAEIGLDLPFLGSDGWDGVLGQLTDADVAEGAIFLSPFIVSEDAVQDFVQDYQTAYSALPDQFAADGYDCVYVIKAAMEQAGSIDNEALIAAMTEIQVDGLTGSVSFSEDGEPDKGAKYIVIVDGEYTAK